MRSACLQKPAFLGHSLEHQDLMIEGRSPRCPGSPTPSPPRAARSGPRRDKATPLKGWRVGKLLVPLQAHALPSGRSLDQGTAFASPWPIFLSDLPEQPGSIPGPECASCKRAFSPYFKKEPVYQLPCGHLLCRPCLGEKQRSLPMTCTACQRPFASQDVLRVHF